MKKSLFTFLIISAVLITGCNNITVESQQVEVSSEPAENTTEDTKFKKKDPYEELSEKYKHLNIISNYDFNENGIDDFSDFVIGARKESERHPTYNGAYVSTNNGYPKREIGVCTDVVWRAFKEAGYSMRSMLIEDIKSNPSRYPMVKKRDDNIDFRRVKTLRPFYEQYCEVLENELDDPENWQPGDIIIFNPRDYHIGILSDKRNKDGFPLVFHNQGQSEREEDFLPRQPVSGHFRFNADTIPKDVLVKWQVGEAGEDNE